MAKIYRAPIAPPDIDWRTPNVWQKQESDYIEALAALARKNGTDKRLGRTVKWQVADGYAVYVVWTVRPLSLVHVAIGDGYSIQPAMARGLKLADIDASIAWDDSISGMMNEHDRFVESLPLGATVHYDNGFGQFVRCIRVAGERGKRLLPVALVGNWAEYDLPRRNRDGSVNEPYQVKKIREQEPFEPNVSNLWEAKDAKGRAWSMRGLADTSGLNEVGLARHREKRYQAPFDPTVEPAIDLTPPGLTVEQERVARLEQTLNRIRSVVGESPREETEEAYRAVLRDVVAAIDEEVQEEVFGRALIRN